MKQLHSLEGKTKMQIAQVCWVQQTKTETSASRMHFVQKSAGEAGHPVGQLLMLVFFSRSRVLLLSFLASQNPLMAVLESPSSLVVVFDVTLTVVDLVVSCHYFPKMRCYYCDAVLLVGYDFLSHAGDARPPAPAQVFLAAVALLQLSVRPSRGY